VKALGLLLVAGCHHWLLEWQHATASALGYA
jgi:hypothetical protein